MEAGASIARIVYERLHLADGTDERKCRMEFLKNRRGGE